MKLIFHSSSKIFFLILFAISAQITLAQDKVFLTNGNELTVNVTGSTRDHVLAKSTNEADPRVYKYPKTEIDRIVYSDGRVEHFSEIPTDTEEPKEVFVDPEAGVQSKENVVEEIEQKKKKPSLKIGLLTGVNSPIGKYGSSSAFDDGYAKTGSFVNLEISFLPSSWIGFGLTLGTASNSIENFSVERKWELPIVSDYEATTTQYSHYYFMIGPQLAFNAEEKLYVDVKIRWGLSFSQEPYYKFSYDSSGYRTIIHNENDSTQSTYTSAFPLSLTLGAGLRYNFSKRFGLSFNVEWMLIPMYFESAQNVEIIEPNGNRIVKQQRTNELYQLSSMLHMGLGFHFLIVNPDK